MIRNAIGGLVIGICVLALALLLLNWFDPASTDAREARIERAEAQARVLAPLWLVVKQGLLVAAGVAGVVLLVGGSWEFVLWLRLRRKLVFPQHALYPAIVDEPFRLPFGVRVLGGPGEDPVRVRPPVNEDKAQIVAALTNGTLDRLPAGAVRPIINPPKGEEMLPAPEPAGLLTAGEAVDVDLVTRPHWLLVGQTGSGKSTAARFVLAEMGRRYPCEFIICEPGGVDWNTAAAAWSEAGIAEAVKRVHDEMRLRLDRLREADKSHVRELGDVRYLVLVVEEMEAVLDDLGDLNKDAQKKTRIRLRQVARMGRKAGVALVAVTQAARTDVFDSHVRTNLANVFLFRNGQTTAEMFRIKGVELPGLPEGKAYSMAHGNLVQFPRVTERPALRVSSLYNERTSPPDLRRVVEGDVLDEDGDVVAGTVATVATDTTGETRSFQSVATVADRLPKRRPTPDEAAAMRAHYARTHSHSATCVRFYGYKDKAVWDWVAMALRGQI